MDIEYHLTLDDLFAFQWRAAYTSASARRTRRRGYLYLLMPFLALGILPAIGASTLAMWLFNFGVIAIVYPITGVLYAMWIRFALRRAVRELVDREKPDKGQIGMHAIAIGPDGLVEKTAVGESRSSWAGVDRIEQDDGYIYIYTTPAAAHVIPKRAFNGSKADEFYRYAVDAKSRGLGATT